MTSMLTRRPPRPAAVLLVGVVVVMSACSSTAGAGSDDTTATRAPNTSSSPEAMPIRDDLVDPQVVPWRSWRSVDDRTLEVTVTAGPTDCYGADPEVVESETEVRVRVRVGLLPQAAETECLTIALESVVQVKLSAPLGTREVEHLA